MRFASLVEIRHSTARRDSRRALARLWQFAAAAALAAALLPAAAGAAIAAAPAGPAAPVASPEPNSVVVSADWPQFHSGAARLGYNAQERIIGPENAPALKLAWSATTGGPNVGSPVVANGVVYVPSLDHKLYAYAVDCAGGGGTCAPLWTATTGSTMYSAPAVDGGVVYVGSDDGKLYAFDAAGVTGCSGTPKICEPLWTATTGSGIESAPAVSGGVVYVGSTDKKLYAFDAAGVTGCSGSPTTCLPLWTGATGAFIISSPAVAGGVVYVGSADHKLYAFDAAGVTDCSGSPTTCTPLWTGATGDAIYSSPAVADGVVYIGSNDNKLHAFAVGCASGGGTCTPLWTGNTGSDIFSSPAVANGVVYVGTNNNSLYAFAVGCAGGGGACSPLWTGVTEGSIQSSSPAVANGVVYVGSNGGKLNAFAVGCAGGGGTCSPIWTVTVGGPVEASPAVVDGVVYVGSDDAGLYAYALEAGIYRTATTYHAITPARVLDTRPTSSSATNIGLSGKFTAGTVRAFGVADAHFVGGGTAVAVPAGATAVTGNLTVTRQNAGGVLALASTMTATGETTTLNFFVGDNRANNVTIGLDPGGTLSAVLRSATVGATADVIFDVTGYFLPNGAGATYHAVSPGRVLDTRPTGSGHTHIGLTGKFKSKVVRTVSVTGVTGIGWISALVPSGAVAITANVTVTTVTSDGYVSVGPTMTTSPKTSTVNTRMGKTTANGVTVALNGSGKLQAVWVGTSGSSADVILDITGYFTADATGLSFHPIVPLRYLDSSTGKGLSGAFVTGTVRTLAVGVSGANVPDDASGIAGNLTLANPGSNGFAFIAPSISGTPTSSTVNSVTGLTAANGFDVPVDGSGQVALVWVGALSSTAHLQLDVTGFWK